MAKEAEEAKKAKEAKEAEEAKKAKEAEAAKKATAAKNEKPQPKKGDIQPYNKVITNDAKTDNGLFKVHSIDDKFYYEIPDSLLDREMLMVTRIAKTASGIGFGGEKQNEQVFNDKIEQLFRKCYPILLSPFTSSIVRF